jgi:hypothetical protein
LIKGKEPMVVDNKSEPPVDELEGEEENTAAWVDVLLRTKFWEPCHRGHKAENRAEGCNFCLQCHEVFCPHCTHDEPDHHLLKVRRNVYRSVILTKDMQELNVDVSRIQVLCVSHNFIISDENQLGMCTS